jgi:hypothetical protein
MRIENGNLNVNGTTKINQLFDYVNSSGITGQVLTSVPSGVQWSNVDAVITGSTTGKLNISDFNSFTASTLPSTYFRQSGNTFGVTAILGTNDSQALSLITSGTSRLLITNTGSVSVPGTINGLLISRGNGNVDTNISIGATTNFSSSATGTHNFAAGNLALSKLTSGNHNTALGLNALSNNTTGNHNTAIGQATLFTNTSGNHNTALGLNALRLNTTGAYNTAIGNGSLENNDTGVHNTSIGSQALRYNTTGGNNTAIGNQALRSNTTGNNNTAIGLASLFTNDTGNHNTAIGYYSLRYNTTGGNNTAIGFRSLKNNTAGNYNTAIGYRSLENNDTGTHNTAIGKYALQSNTTGYNNTAIGNAALRSNTAGNYNTAFGFQALFTNDTGNHNTAIGKYALRLNTTGAYNTAIGKYALQSNTTGYNNTAIGNAALQSNTIGTHNTAIGLNTLRYNTTGGNNIAIGYRSLENNDTGVLNTAIGQNALRYNTTGVSNAAIGNQALRSNTTGNDNTAIGNESLQANTTGNHNTAIGQATLFTNTSGNHNTALGLNALRLNTTGSNNIAIGNESLYSNTTGTSNTAIGLNTLRANTTGGYNTAIGREALRYNTTGSSNTAIGYNAGRFIADGSTANAITDNSIFIGRNTRVLANNQTNQIVIGDSAIGLGSNTVVLGDTNITTTALRGNVGIGTSTPSQRLDVNGDVRIRGDIFDSTNTSGTTGQVLTSTPSGIQWSNVDAVITGSTTDKLNISDFNSFTANTLPSTYFRQSGNTFGVTALLGTNDNQDLAFETNGTVRMSVLSGGNVGIGTNNPSTKLNVKGDSGDIIRFEDTGGVAGVLGATGSGINRMYLGYGAEHLSIFSSGNIGIGTTSPTSRLQVKGGGSTSSTTGLRVEDSNGISSLVIRDDRRIGMGVDNPSTQLHISGTSLSNPLLINTSGGTTGLVVNNSGNVGIGTTSPSHLLDVHGNARVMGNGLNTYFRIQSDASNRESRILFINHAQRFNVGIPANTNNFSIQSSNGGTPTSIGVDFNTGNVGVGISDPSAQLHISGLSSSSLLQVGSPSNSNLLVISGSNNIGIAMPPSNISTLSIRALSSAGGNFSQRWFEPDGVTEVARVRNSSSVGFEVSRLGNIGTSNLLLVGNPGIIINHGNGNNGSITLGDTTSTDFTVPLGSGNITNVAISRPFNLISGSSNNNLTGLLINNIVNSTGSTNTTYKALHIRPTVHPSVSLYNSIETESGNVIFNGGNVGLGVTTPLAELHISGTSAFNPLLINTSGGTTGLVVNNTGNVGVGTNTPVQNLEVIGTSYFSGRMGIGASYPSNSVGLAVTSQITGSVIAYGIAQRGYVQNDVTLYAGGIQSQLNKTGAGTLPAYYNFLVNGGGSIAGSVTSQMGYTVLSNFTEATNNYGFYGDLASATGVWNLYMNGTADNYLAGRLGIGTTSPTARLQVKGAGATSSTTGLRVEDSNGISSLVIRDDRTIGVGIDNPSAQFHISGNTSSSNPLLVNTSGGTVALSVNNLGNVGIGTSTPSARFQVRGLGDSSIWITSEDFNAGTNTGTVVRLGTTNSTGNSAGTIDVLNSGISGLSGNLTLARFGGNVGIGTSTPAFTLDVNGTARATTLLETSSERYKINIIPLPSQLDTINKLNPVTFNWKDETKGNGIQYGLIAEEVLNIIPDAVETNDDGTAEAISYTKLVPILIKAVQELQMEVNELKEKLNK